MPERHRVWESRGVNVTRGGSPVGELLANISARLTDAGIDDARTDAELIVAHAIGEGRGRVQALTVLGSRITEAQEEVALDISAERARRVPLQHLTGRAAFRNLELSVGPGVFVPRPETEGVAQLAIDALQDNDGGPIAVDLCTGSGAIALAIATEVPTSRVWAVEKSPEAHAWAARNVARLGEGRVTLKLGDVAEVGESLAELQDRVDVVVSNPPYVPNAMVPRDPEVHEHDPALALYGGTDGLDIVRVIARVAQDLVVPGGSIVLEHAESQGEAIRDLLEASGWLHAETRLDLTGRDRATTALRPASQLPHE